MAGRDMGWFTYTSDDGNSYSVRIRKDIGENLAAGFGAMDVTKKPLPKGQEMRFIYAQDPANGNTRKVPVGSTTCDLWTGVVTTVTLAYEGDADGASFNVKARRQEKLPTVSVIRNL